MSYIGATPQIGGYHKLDQITTDGSASYTMQLNSGNFVPESANHLIVSVNGVIQAPTDSFTVSGSTITFASSLSVSDTIDFIMALGNTLDIGTPSDGTISASKLATTSITGQTAETSANDSDSLLIYDDSATALRKMTRANFLTGVGGTNSPYFYGVKASNQTINRGTLTVINGFTSNELDSDSAFNGQTFTVPSGKGGLYYFHANLFGSFGSVGNDGEEAQLNFRKNGSTINYPEAKHLIANTYNIMRISLSFSIIQNLSVGDTIEVSFSLKDGDASSTTNHTVTNQSHFMGFKLI